MSVNLQVSPPLDNCLMFLLILVPAITFDECTFEGSLSLFSASSGNTKGKEPFSHNGADTKINPGPLAEGSSTRPLCRLKQACYGNSGLSRNVFQGSSEKNFNSEGRKIPRTETWGEESRGSAVQRVSKEEI